MDDYYAKRKFDPYLQFASSDDERDYRRREAERLADIERVRALHTPEGDLRASQLAIEQLKDAGAHGADKSPDYKPALDKLTASDNDLQQKLAQATKPKEPTPPNPAPNDVTAALKAAGVSLADDTDKAHVVPAKQAANSRGPSGPT